METEKYHQEHYAFHTNIIAHPEDTNLQIYPVKGKRRTEYISMGIKNKEPQTEKKRERNPYHVSTHKQITRKKQQHPPVTIYLAPFPHKNQTKTA